MGVISSLGKNLAALPAVLQEIEDDLEGWKDHLKIDGKNIQTANVEQPAWLAYYDQIAVRCYTILQYVDMLENKVRGDRMKFVKDTFGKVYTDSSIQKVIDADPEYIKMHTIYIEVKELYDRVKSIVESFKQRAYSLNNIVKIREHELEGVTIRLDD